MILKYFLFRNRNLFELQPWHELYTAWIALKSLQKITAWGVSYYRRLLNHASSISGYHGSLWPFCFRPHVKGLPCGRSKCESQGKAHVNSAQQSRCYRLTCIAFSRTPITSWMFIHEIKNIVVWTIFRLWTSCVRIVIFAEKVVYTHCLQNIHDH